MSKNIRWYLDDRFGAVFRWTFPAPQRVKDAMLRNFYMRGLDRVRDVVFEDLYFGRHE